MELGHDTEYCYMYIVTISKLPTTNNNWLTSLSSDRFAHPEYQLISRLNGFDMYGEA